MNPAVDPLPALRKPVTKLSTTQQFRLLDWMRLNESAVKAQADTKLARIAAAELDFEITPTNFTHAREAAGITKLEPPKPKTLEEQFAELRRLVEDNQLLLTGVCTILDVNLTAGQIIRPHDHLPGMDTFNAHVEAAGATSTGDIPVPSAFQQPIPEHPGRMTTEMPSPDPALPGLDQQQ